MKRILLRTIVAIVLLNISYLANAQGPGSEAVYGGSGSTRSIAAGTSVADAAETIYLGPGQYDVNGTWEIYSKNVVIDPAAVISGTGSIVFNNPSDAGGDASFTLIDGNGSSNAIDVDIVNNNPSGIILTQIDFPDNLVDDGFTNNDGSATLYVGGDLNLAVDGANVMLANRVVGDLRFTSMATISNFGPQRMVITNNSIISHMVRDAYTGSFTFPVGIAAGDYTPAVINNTVSNAVHVSVTDYSANTSDVTAVLASSGVQRIWNIYAGNATGNSTISLQNNNSTNQQSFSNSSNFVTQYNGIIPNTTGDATSTDAWQNNTPGTSSTGDVSGSSVNSRAYTTFATDADDATANFSKRTFVQTALPVTLLSFAASSQSCSVKLTWTTADETNFSRFELQRSADNGTSYSTISTIQAGGNNSHYNYTDVAAVQGTNIYRLKMIDIDGQYKFSNTALATVNCSDKPIVLYPNPTRGSLNISGLKGGQIIQLYNANGQLLVQQKAVNTQQQLDLTRYANGLYTVIVLDNTKRLLVSPIIKNK
ncbi:MAG: T9SS type A sorting domain-containing protein [Chitinophagaceae bacterium]